MQASVGLPVMMLDRQNHYGKKNQKHGNWQAILNEALEERQCSDPDLNRELTEKNQYLIFDDLGLDEECLHSGYAWSEAYAEMADSYRIVDKNGKEKRLRSDANIAFAGIIKPDSAFMSSLDRKQQAKFLRDSMDCIREIYNKRGMSVDMCVAHVDEGNPHIHYFGHDPKYKLSDKFNLSFYRALNVTEFPKMMSDKGWDVKKLTGYIENTKGMSDDQLDEYKAKRKAVRKSGMTSEEYKRLQEQKKAEQKAKALEDKIRRLQDKKDKFIEDTNKQAVIIRQQAREQAKQEAEEIRQHALREAQAIREQAYNSIDEQTRRDAENWRRHIAERNNTGIGSVQDSRQSEHGFSR